MEAYFGGEIYEVVVWDELRWPHYSLAKEHIRPLDLTNLVPVSIIPLSNSNRAKPHIQTENG